MNLNALSPSADSFRPGTTWAARLCRTLPVIGMAAGMDQFTKYWAIRHLDPALPLIFLDGTLRLQLVLNPGIHLGLGADWDPLLRFWLFYVAAASIALALLFATLTSRNQSGLWWVGSSLLISGIASNAVDRLLHDGQAVDFINVTLYAFSTGVFNLADMEIVVGLILLVPAYLKGRNSGA